MSATTYTEQCTATAKSSGTRCKIRVTAGGVCRKHGGAAPQVRAKRLERIALAEQLAAAPRRHPGDVLLEALHLSDVLAQQALRQLDEGNATPKMLRAAVEASLRSAALSRTTMSAESEAVRSSASNDIAAQHLRSALGRFMDTLGLTGSPDAEAALDEAVRSVASQEWMPLHAAAAKRGLAVSEQMGQMAARLITGVFQAMGLDPQQPWPSSVIRSFLRATERDEVQGWLTTAGDPPQSWWLELAKHACRRAGLPNPVPVVSEILPPQRPFALTDGAP